MAGRIVVLDQLALLEERAVQIVGVAGRGIGRAAAEGHALTLILEIDDEDVLDGALRRGGPQVVMIIIGMGGERQKQCHQCSGGT